jgi:glycine/D-amino acid oxidase-like deaminating enzyme
LTAHVAARLPRQKGPAAWNAILPDHPGLPMLDRDGSADVVVIGGGFAGLSAARRLHLLDPGLRVAVLEAGRIAESAAGRNSGFMIDLPHDLATDNYAGAAMEADRATIARNRQAIGFARAVAEACALGDEVFDPAGKINAAATDAGDRHNRDYAAHLEKLGEPATLLDAPAMRDLTGSTHYTSGLYTPGTVMLQPAGYIRALADWLNARIDVYEHTPATAIARQGNGWRVTTPGGSLVSGAVILANNGHLESFGFYRRRLMHVCLYASMSARMSAEDQRRLGGARRWGVTPADPMGTSVRRISGSYGDRLLIRTCATFNPGQETRDMHMAYAARVHDRKFAERFPQLGSLQMEHRWAGMLCLSRNGSAAFGELEPGLYAACCQNGLGTARGTLQGMAIADLVTGTASDIADHFATEEIPPMLPPAPVAAIGANAYLKWQEWRSGRE